MRYVRVAPEPNGVFWHVYVIYLREGVVVGYGRSQGGLMRNEAHKLAEEWRLSAE